EADEAADPFGTVPDDEVADERVAGRDSGRHPSARHLHTDAAEQRRAPLCDRTLCGEQQKACNCQHGTTPTGVMAKHNSHVYCATGVQRTRWIVSVATGRAPVAIISRAIRTRT